MTSSERGLLGRTMSKIACFEFNEGPLDGATLELPSDELFLVRIIVSVQAKGITDNDEVWTDEICHEYSCCHSWEVEGQNRVWHYLGHLKAERKQSE